MANVIDERVVEMKFDNKNFESNVKTTMSTLEKLKQALKFKGATDGLEQVNTSASKLNFNPMVKAIDTVQVKFSTLQAAASAALGNIASAGISAATNLIKQFVGIDAIKAGFAEYETQINSIQTIMSNTSNQGTTMEDVRSALDELNTYADKTIYNFAEMTRNIGTFTAAGVDLETSVSSIQGIANLAAMSGSSSLQASTAMYQLSQAIAAGRVALMDWNSVVNAGMGGAKFQEALKQTAREFNIDVDSMIEKHGSFRESLQEGWITAEVLTTTLSKMTVEGAEQYAQAMLESGQYTQEQADALIAEAQAAEDAATKVKTLTQLMDTLKEAMGSGWTKTWELFLGDFDEAKEFFTGISDMLGEVINNSSDARNNMLEGALSGNGGGSSWYDIKDQIESAGISYDAFKEKCIEVARENGVAIDEMIEKAGSFEATLKDGWLNTDIFSQVTESMKGTVGDAATTLEEYQRVVDEIWAGEWGDGEERIQRLTEAGYDYATMQQLVDSTADGHRLTLEELSDEQLEAIGITEEQAAALDELNENWGDLSEDLTKQTGRELIFEGISNIIQTLIDLFGALGDAWNEVFPPMTSERLYEIIEGFRDFTESIKPSEETLDKLQTVFKGIFSLIELIIMPLQAVADGIGELFGKIDAGAAGSGILDFLVDISNNIINFVSTVKLSGVFDKWVSNVIELFESLADIVKNVWTVVSDFFSGLLDGLGISFEGIFPSSGDIFGFLQSLVDNPILDGIKQAFTGIGDAIEGIVPMAEGAGQTVGNFFKNIDLSGFVTMLTSAFEAVKNFFGTIGSNIGPAFQNAFESISGFFSGIDLSGFTSVFTSAFDTVKDRVSSFVETVKGIWDQVSSIFSQSFGTKILESFDGFSLDGFVSAFTSAFETIKDKIEGFIDTIRNLWDRITSIFGKSESKDEGLRPVADRYVVPKSFSTSFDGARNAFMSFVTTLSAGASTVGDALSSVVDGIKGFASDIGSAISDALDVVGDFLSKIDFGGIGGLLAGFGVAAGGTGISKFFKSFINPFESISNAIGTIAGGFGGISNGVVDVLGGVKDTIASYQKDIQANTIIKIAAAIGILAASLWVLSTIDPVSLGAASGAMIVLVTALTAATKILSKGGSDIEGAGKSLVLMIGMAASMLILASACKKLEDMDPESLGVSVLGIAALMIAMSTAINIMGDSKGGLGKAVQIIAMAGAIKMVATVVEELGALDTGAMIKGVAATSVLALALGAFAKLSEKSRGLSSGLGMIAVAGSMMILVSVVQSFAEMDTGDLIKGAAGLTAALAVVSLALAIMSSTRGSALGAGLGFGATVTALLLLVQVIEQLGSMDLSTLAVGIGALAAAMVVMAGGIALVGVASKLLSGSSLALLAFGASVTLIGVGMAAAGVGIVAFSAGLASLVALFATSGGTLVEAIGAIGTAIADLIPTLAEKFGEGLIAICGVINENAPVIGETFKTVIRTLIDVIVSMAPELAEGFFQLVLSMLEELTEYVPQIIDQFIELILGIIETLTARVPELVGAGVEFLNTLFTSIVDAFKDVDFDTMVEGLKIVGMIDALLLALGVGAVLAIPALAGVVLIGVVVAAIAGILAALGALKQIDGFDWFVSEGKQLLIDIGDAIGQFAGSVIGGFAEGISNSFPAIGENLSSFMENASGFIDGCKNVDATVSAGAGYLAGAIVKIGAANLIESITDLLSVGSSLGDLGTKLSTFITNLEPFTTAVSGYDENTFAGLTDLTTAIVGLSEANLISAIADIVRMFAGEEETDLSSFGDDISDLGEGLEDFVEAFNGITINDGVTSAVAVATELVNLANLVPPEGFRILLGDLRRSSTSSTASRLTTALSRP